jgi:enoyl-CoA hydratase/carnithine racemase
MKRELKLSTERMLGHIEDGIGWMTFNNPARHNALSLEMWLGMAEIMTAFADDPQVRVVVLRGAGGKAFVSGADISEFEKERANAEQKAAYGRIAGQGARALATYPKPVIALIEGYCIGGGLATALSADVRFATSDARFGIPAAKLGLGYEYDGLAKLARLVGPSRARDILFSARFMDATEAHAMGLVNFVEQRDSIEARVVDYATTIARNAPLTVAAAKAALNAFERGGRTDEVRAVEVMVETCFDSTDYKEGRRAFMDKRPPRFEGR